MSDDAMANARAKVRAHLEASKRKAAAEPTLCIEPECRTTRAPGKYLCAKHQANVDRLNGSAAPAKPSRLDRLEASLERAARRPGDAELVCPHCQVKGRVTSRRIKQKKGISGGKATGALLTGGLSMLGTGLSRKEKATEMRCHNCNTTWYV